MDLFTDMNIFVAVVKANSFRRGAEALGLPPSTVSRRISQLEQRIGLRLLNRTTRSIALTDAGQIYFGRCRRLVDEANLAHEELQRALTEAEGTLRMSLPADFAQRFMAPLIAEFVEKHPNVRFRLDLSPQQVNLAQDPFDLAVRIGQLKDSAMISRRVTQLERHVYGAPEMVRYWREGVGAPRWLQMEGRSQNWPSGSSHQNTGARIVANSIGMLIRLTSMGCGLAVLPDLLVQEEVKNGALERVETGEKHLPLPVFALTETRLLPAKTRLFIEFMAEKLGEH